MSKEELEKEAEEYLEKKHCKNVCTYNEIEECKVGVRIRCMSFNYRKKLIVDFAEPKEKQIADLEDKLAKADYQLEGRDNEIRELKEQNEKMKCCENCKHSNTTCECYTICTIGHYDDCKSNTVLDSLDKKDYWEN